ncbi:restriction endonuclease subunit S [Persicitalea jodogahamensis]|uniref:Type I restriction modification DNA specificity domain-containing protein n=1 Tax=Persicitalea jodogahamensis TaxID=402147 RepID=A0A8J3DCU9_9BACT|nr:restriction endonuclease subunit S [Persicitalea jodogahamensis]GHB83835.1 hypothetical protein GCM10007390_43730 [Persicitalea jodogahamensis]
MIATEAATKELNIEKTLWKKVQLGDVVKEVRETVKDPAAEGIDRIVGLEHLESENLHLNSWAELSEGTTFTKVFRKGQMLFGRRRAYLKKAALATFDGICSGDITVLEARKGLIPELLPFLIQNDTFFDLAVKNSAGSLSPRAKLKDFADYEFLLPPKDQQAQLAELLWAADAVVERELDVPNKLIVQLNVFAKNSISQENDPYKKPLGWKTSKLGLIGKVQAGSTPLRATMSFYENGSIPWVKTLDLNNGEITQTEEKITQEAIDSTSCKVRPVNTVLVAMYGGFNQIGRTGILRTPAATNQAVSAIMVDSNIILPDFLLLVLNTKIEYWKKVAVSSRKDPNITKVDVENFPIVLPSIREQKEILLTTNLLHQVIGRAESKVLSTKTLLKSLINQIF